MQIYPVAELALNGFVAQVMHEGQSVEADGPKMVEESLRVATSKILFYSSKGA